MSTAKEISSLGSMEELPLKFIIDYAPNEAQVCIHVNRPLLAEKLYLDLELPLSDEERAELLSGKYGEIAGQLGLLLAQVGLKKMGLSEYPLGPNSLKLFSLCLQRGLACDWERIVPKVLAALEQVLGKPEEVVEDKLLERELAIDYRY